MKARPAAFCGGAESEKNPWREQKLSNSLEKPAFHCQREKLIKPLMAANFARFVTAGDYSSELAEPASRPTGHTHRPALAGSPNPFPIQLMNALASGL